MERLEISSDQKHFTCGGTPFFWVRDTVWSAFTNATEEEWAEYLACRKVQGFNMLQINTLPQWDRCLTEIMFGKPISCTVNPSVESSYIAPAEEKKKVLVIGGGPAGMEAAYVAKKRGHEVVLCEKTGELGGLLRLAAVPISKQEICKVIKFMRRRLENEGIEIRMNCEVTAEMLTCEFAGL